MSDPINIDTLLGRAYHLDQRGGHRQQAIAMIREAATDEAVAAFLRQKRDQLHTVRESRRFGERDGCHVTGVLVDLLNAALVRRSAL